MPSKIISKFWDPDHTKMAVVHVDTKTCAYFVEYYLNDQLVVTKDYPCKSLYWVEDCAENYTLGILNVSEAT